PVRSLNRRSQVPSPVTLVVQAVDHLLPQRGSVLHPRVTPRSGATLGRRGQKVGLPQRGCGQSRTWSAVSLAQPRWGRTLCVGRPQGSRCAATLGFGPKPCWGRERQGAEFQ